MSDLRVTRLKGRTVGSSPSLPDGAVVTGVTTSGSLNIIDTTQSTSATTGAVVISGGVGIAKSLHVGGNVSVGGTLTYEDVTNIDSVGLITARSGVHYGNAGSGTLVQGNSTGIGIGVAPTRELTIYSPDSSSTYINLTNSTTGTTTGDGFGIGLSGDEAAKVWNYENTYMSFATNATERLRISSAGLVGISTATPVATLHVDGNQVINAVAMAANSVDCQKGNYFVKEISGATTFTFDNVPTQVYGFTLELKHTGGSGSITWPTPNVKWPADTPPTLTDGKTSLLMFITDDGGTRWRGSSLADYTN